MQRILGFVLGAIAGGVIGAGVALLIAPSAGEDLRDQIQGRARTVVNQVKGAAEERRIELEYRLAELRAPHHPSAD